MKKFTYLLAAVFMLTATNAMAHCGMCGMNKKDDMPVNEKADKKVEKLTEKLGLTQEQAAKAKPIIEEKLSRKKAIKSAKMAELDAVKADFNAKFEAVLTEEQKAKYKELKAEWAKDKKVECPFMKEHGHKKGSDMKMEDAETGM